MKEEGRNIISKEEGIRGGSLKAPPQTWETMVAEIRDHPDHYHKETTLIQVTTTQKMVEEEAEAKPSQGDQNVLILLTPK